MMILRSHFADAPMHGFFARLGGVSQGIYESLNVGSGSQDNAEHVKENRDRAAEALGFSPTALLTPYQIHSPTCLYVNEPLAAEPSPEPSPSSPRADAYVTDKPGLLLGVVTADCLPVLMWEPCGIIAAAHAGWKGALAGILDSTLACMRKRGGKLENIRAVIGPAIAAKSYEVQEDFYRTITQADKSYRDFFTASKGNEGYYFDLPGFAERRLRTLGVGKIDIIDEDTLSQEDKFFSYRRACLQKKTDYGRQLSAIGL